MSSIIKLLKIIHKSFAERDPVIPEIVSNYEEYHETTDIASLNYIRANLIAGWIEPESSCLDVGCGEGSVLEFLSKTKKCKLHGMDISQLVIEAVRSKGFQGIVRNVDKEGLALTKDQRYDYILFNEVLEHLKYPHKVLVEACKHADKGVIVNLPNSGYIFWRLQLLRGYSPRQSFTHLHFWTINDFRIFLNVLNLRPLDSKTELSTRGIKGVISRRFKNLLSYQQSWLIAPKKS